MQNFVFHASTEVTFDPAADTEVLAEFWNGFCSRAGVLVPKTGEPNRISIGTPTFLPLADGEEYTVCIRPEGVGILGRDLPTLSRGFSAFLMQIETIGKDTFRAGCRDLHGSFSVRRRMIHLCVFPNTTLQSLRRLVRLCGILAYTHVVIEFWGMLHLDAMKELAWENAYTKAEIRPILREARAMGMEPIPMMNQLGHAAGCRLSCGKHVVLDQNPRLQSLFTPDGWCWSVFSPEVQTLLKKVRAELCELFGSGEYFHIGCDEAYMYSSGYFPLSGLVNYLKNLTAEVVAEGRRPILWGDMIIPYETSSENADVRAAAWEKAKTMRPLLDALHPQSIIADWQYDIKTAPIPSTEAFAKSGFDTIGCPWDQTGNIDAMYDTALSCNLYGLMMTTWHTLSEGIHSVLYFARKCGAAKALWSDHAGHPKLETAVLLRKLSPEGLPYEETGYRVRQIVESGNG